MKLNIKTFYPNYCYLRSLKSKYSPQHFIVKKPESVFYPLNEGCKSFLETAPQFTLTKTAKNRGSCRH